MGLKLYKIRGHHLVDLADFLYEPEKVRNYYLAKGYGAEFVKNQAEVFADFIFGRAKIKLVAGSLDDICKSNCKYGDKVEIPCDDPRGTELDTKTAGYFLLEIGKTYLFVNIEQNLRNFYLDRHSM
jgi:hypothetical protein